MLRPSMYFFMACRLCDPAPASYRFWSFYSSALLSRIRSARLPAQLPPSLFNRCAQSCSAATPDTTSA